MATAKDRQHEQWQSALAEAFVAGLDAARTKVPVPMIVGTPRNMMASLLGGDDGGFDPNEPTYFVSGGVCGFAWLLVKKDRRFQNWLTGKVASKYPAAAVLSQHEDAVSEPRPDSYYGGVNIWVRVGGQSMQVKEAFAGAFAQVLSEAVPTATIYAQSRMD